MGTMDADKAIRVSTAGVVTAVAGFAAVVSYSHIYDLARAHGQSGTAARLLPLSVDGLILAASLVMLHEARSGHSAPVRAYLMLGLGVAATVAANVLYGLGFGALGAVISAWPAVAFVGAVEMCMWLIRKARPEPGVDPALSDLGDVLSSAVPSDAESAALAALKATLAAGNPFSARQLETRFGLTRAQSTRVRQLAGTNGHAPDPERELTNAP
jgi:hypothetical protein